MKEKFNLDPYIREQKDTEEQDDTEKKDEEKENEDKKISRREFLKKMGDTMQTMAVGSATGLIYNLLKEEEKKKSLKIIESKSIKKDEKDEYKKDERPISKDHGKNKERNIADIYLDAYYEVSRKDEFLPSDIFTNDLFIAQQLQESGFDNDAKSKAGALGTMQNMRVSVEDVGTYLYGLKRKNKIKSNTPKKLKDRQIEEIMSLIPQDADYSRAFGKTYMMALFDPKNGYAVGRKKYLNGDIRGAQKEILACYNGGMGRVLHKKQKGRLRKAIPEEEWLSESSEYCEKIFNYMERIKNIRQEFAEYNLDSKNDYIVMLTAREMDKFRERKDKYGYLFDFIKKIEAKQLAEKRYINNDEMARLL